MFSNNVASCGAGEGVVPVKIEGFVACVGVVVVCTCGVWGVDGLVEPKVEGGAVVVVWHFDFDSLGRVEPCAGCWASN